MKHKVGDRLQIKDSYDIKKHHDDVYGGPFFISPMFEYCGLIAEIKRMSGNIYIIDLDGGKFDWSDWMFEDNDEQQTENSEQQPISDTIHVSKNYVLSDNVVSFDELEQLADNHKSVAWKHNDNTYTLKPAAIFLSWSYRLLKLSLPNLYNVVLNDKANIIGEELYKQGLVNGENIQKVIDITRKILK